LAVDAFVVAFVKPDRTVLISDPDHPAAGAAYANGRAPARGEDRSRGPYPAPSSDAPGKIFRLSFATIRSTNDLGLFRGFLSRGPVAQDRPVLALLLALIAAVGSALRSRANLAIENLALRQQIAVLRRRRPRPPLAWTDRLFWVALSRMWSRWRSALVIVRPDTVVRWHRAAFRCFWTWRSRRAPGRPPIDHPTRDLVRQMAQSNPCGAPRAFMARCSSSASGTRGLPPVAAPAAQAAVSDMAHCPYQSLRLARLHRLLHRPGRRRPPARSARPRPAAHLAGRVANERRDSRRRHRCMCRRPRLPSGPHLHARSLARTALRRPLGAAEENRTGDLPGVLRRCAALSTVRSRARRTTPPFPMDHPTPISSLYWSVERQARQPFTSCRCIRCPE
jgi:hypothetical protein